MPSYDERVVSLIVFIFLPLGANLTGVWGPEKGPWVVLADNALVVLRVRRKALRGKSVV